MMLLRLLLGDIESSKPRLLFMLILAGVTNAGVLAVINAAAGQTKRDFETLQLGLMFGVLIVLYALSQRFIMVVASGEAETTIHRLRARLMDKLLRCELLDVEALGRSRLQAALGADSQILSQFATTLVLGGQAAVLVVFAMMYLAWLSMTNFLLCVAYLLVIVRLYFRRTDAINQGLHQALRRENELQDALSDLLNGFKEVKMDGRRRATIQQEATSISDDASWKRISVAVDMARSFVFSQTAFFLLLATSVFIIPLFSDSGSDVASKTVATILFLSGPISGLMAMVPVYARANAAAENIRALDQELDQCLERAAQGHAMHNRQAYTAPIPRAFKTISFENVYFSHDTNSAHPFVVGPIDLTVHAGEITFITGGNGSGKSTLLKLLTALVTPQSGTIRIDGVAVSPRNAQDYRDLFSTVFSDYHLFSRLYGIEPPPAQDMDRQLADFELADKTRLEGDRFQTLDLSSGQRRRLALLIAMMEAKPICVLDEWAADQDPAFRLKFYQEILPALKARGVTVIAVTHDDKYFSVCDRHVRMEEGRLIDNGPSDPEQSNRHV